MLLKWCSMARKRILNYIYLIISILSLAITVAWMVTVAQQGELLTYSRKLIIPTINMNVKLYEYKNEEYVEVTDRYIDLNNLAPGDKKNYKFVMTNNDEELGTAKIVFTSITGDLDILKGKIYINALGPMPYIQRNLLGDKLELKDGVGLFRFLDKVEVPGLSTLELLWQIEVPTSASNEIAGKELIIDTISVLKP